MQNVILLTIDTLRKDVLGCYGSKDGLTPFLDSIMDKCVIFDNHQSTGPYTQASFPGILASSYFLEYGNPINLSPQRTLISEVVKRGGFATAAFHSNPYLLGLFGWDRGWDFFYDSIEDHVTRMVPYVTGDKITRKASAWLSSHTKKSGYKPFFLWAHYMDVHEPYLPDRKYLNFIDPSLDLSKEEMFAMFNNVILPRDISDTAKVAVLKKLYCAHVIQVDEYVRAILDSLHSLELLDNTTIIITSDHGDEFADHSGLSHDGKMYSELLNVPLIIYDPQRTTNQRVATYVSGVDISPTIANMFGLKVPDTFHGQPLLPLENYEPRGCFGEAIGKLAHKVKPSDRPVHFYQEGSLRISHRIEDDKWEMYDLSSDPKEQNNIFETNTRSEEMAYKLKSKINWFNRGDSPVINVANF